MTISGAAPKCHFVYLSAVMKVEALWQLCHADYCENLFAHAKKKKNLRSLAEKSRFQRYLHISIQDKHYEGFNMLILGKINRSTASTGAH